MKLKVGCRYTTDCGYVLRCLGQSVLAKGRADGKGNWKSEPKYIYSLKVLDGPVEANKNKHLTYYASGKPARFFECGDIVDELSL